MSFLCKSPIWRRKRASSVSFSSTSNTSSPQTVTFTLTDGGGTTNTMIADIDLTYNEIDDPEDEDMSMEAMSVEFSAKPKGADGSSSKIVVNKGEMYTVMSTITDIIKHYLRKSRGDIKAILYCRSIRTKQ